MNNKIVLLALWACTLTSAAFAQEENSKIKLSKNEKIWVAAFDDTTKALASLFISKRNQDRKEQHAAYYVLGASVTVMGAGLILASRDTDAAPGGSTEQDMNMSFVPILLGFSGILWSGFTLVGHAIDIHPYTVKKYNRLLVLYESGKPIPTFYEKRMNRFLH